MIITLKSADFAPNQLPDGAIKFDDGTIMVDLTPDQLTKWIEKQSLELREQVLNCIIKGLQNGDIKTG